MISAEYVNTANLLPGSYYIDKVDGTVYVCMEVRSDGGLSHYCKLSELFKDYQRLLASIRKHRDQRGDDRCWLDDEELYRVLPEGYIPPVRDSSVELKNCEKYIASRHNPATEYVSPEREIELLRAERDELHERLKLLLGTDGL